jgi:hypothetical protein
MVGMQREYGRSDVARTTCCYLCVRSTMVGVGEDDVVGDSPGVGTLKSHADLTVDRSTRRDMGFAFNSIQPVLNM